MPNCEFCETFIFLKTLPQPGFVVHSVNLNGKLNTGSLDSVVYKAADLSLSMIPSEVSQTPSSTGTTLACQAETDKY